MTAHDPIAIPNARLLLGDSVEFAADPASAIRDADCCIIMTEWDEFRKLSAKDYIEAMRSPNLVDARRLYKPEDFEGLNLLGIGLGKDKARGG